MRTDSLKITFLGTGTSQGVPVPACNCAVCQSPDAKDKRLRASVLIETNNRKLLIDAGPDFRYQMLRKKIMHLDAILLTHGHRDHTAGLDDLRSYNYFQQKPVPVFCESRVEETIRQEFFYAFKKTVYRGIPEFDIHLISDTPFEVFGIPVIPIRAMHWKLPVLGFRIGNFAYITDANYIAPQELEKINGIDVLVLNALRKQPHVSHFNLQEALSIIKTVTPQQAYLTHISHLMGFHAEVSKELPKNVALAYDQLSFCV
jgi:phosphoribosyl 1,2-cyclic phosphate phosphodiesterase